MNNMYLPPDMHVISGLFSFKPIITFFDSCLSCNLEAALDHSFRNREDKVLCVHISYYWDLV